MKASDWLTCWWPTGSNSLIITVNCIVYTLPCLHIFLSFLQIISKLKINANDRTNSFGGEAEDIWSPNYPTGWNTKCIIDNHKLGWIFWELFKTNLKGALISLINFISFIEKGKTLGILINNSISRESGTYITYVSIR